VELDAPILSFEILPPARVLDRLAPRRHAEATPHLYTSPVEPDAGPEVLARHYHGTISNRIDIAGLIDGIARTFGLWGARCQSTRRAAWPPTLCVGTVEGPAFPDRGW
jgi:hypothetical protein